MRTQRHNSWSV